MRYPFVLFDAGETLLGPRESFGATYARALGPMGLELPSDVFEAALRQTWDELNRIVPRGADRYRHFDDGERGYWLRFARGTIERASDRPVSDEFAESALERLREAFRSRAAWSVYDDVFPALAALRADGVRLGIVSNWDSRLPRILEMLDLVKHFSTVTISHLEGIEKPEPEIFRRALASLGAHAEESLHVGDVPEIDLCGAHAAGIDAVLVDRRRRLPPGLPKIADLSSLPGIARDGLP